MAKVYYVVSGDTLPIPFDTFDGGTGASITMTGLAVTDIEIYKDLGVTQRASDNGYTLADTDGIDFDGITGIHGFTIDLSDNSDAGFYSVGPWYQVVISSITVDGQTVNFVAAEFRILDATRGMAGTALPDAAADAAGGLPISDAGGLDLDAMNTNINDIETDTADMQPKLGTITDLGGGATVGNNLADMAGATFATATDSQEAIRNHIGDGTNLSEAGGAGDHLSAVPWNASWDAEVQSEVQDALDAAQTESYRANGATGSIVQLLYEILSNLTEFAYSGTTKTNKKLDHSTTATTHTLDDGTNPTSSTRAT